MSFHLSEKSEEKDAAAYTGGTCGRQARPTMGQKQRVSLCRS
jgi:hypothetical protein